MALNLFSFRQDGGEGAAEMTRANYVRKSIKWNARGLSGDSGDMRDLSQKSAKIYAGNLSLFCLVMSES